jgi:nucleolar protein 9
MPRGLRKRGRRHKEETEQEEQAEVLDESHIDNQTAENDFQTNHVQTGHSPPSWIIPSASRYHDEGFNSEAPFGFVDAEVKAYFRTVDVQIREWQESPLEKGEEENVDADPNEGVLIPLGLVLESFADML